MAQCAVSHRAVFFGKGTRLGARQHKPLTRSARRAGSSRAASAAVPAHQDFVRCSGWLYSWIVFALQS